MKALSKYSHMDEGPSIWPHFTLITFLKAVSSNTVTFWGTRCWNFSKWIGRDEGNTIQPITGNICISDMTGSRYANDIINDIIKSLLSPCLCSASFCVYLTSGGSLHLVARWPGYTIVSYLSNSSWNRICLPLGDVSIPEKTLIVPASVTRPSSANVQVAEVLWWASPKPAYCAIPVPWKPQ